MVKRLFLRCVGGELMLAAFAILGCSSTRTAATEHRHMDSISVEARKVDAWTSNESVSEYIREIIVMQADTAGDLRPVLKIVEKSRNEEKQKTAENLQKFDSAAFSKKSEVITKETEEKPVEAIKTTFWRNAFFLILCIAAIVIGVVTLLRKTLSRWM